MRWAHKASKYPTVVQKTSTATTLRGLLTDRSRQQGTAERRGARPHPEEGPEYQVPACRSRRIVSRAWGIVGGAGFLLGALPDSVHVQIEQAAQRAGI